MSSPSSSSELHSGQVSGVPNISDAQEEAYDYIIVGGGSAGCVLAADLAKEGDFRVLLLEAGPPAEGHPECLAADGYKDAFINDSVIWERFSLPQAHLAKQRIFMGAGGVMGGSGSVNGMVYTRGSREDWDEWPPGWQWEDVIADFEILEKSLRPNRRPPTLWTEACISAAEMSGFKHETDLNDGNLSNVIGYEWMNYEGDRRRSSYVSFIADAPARPNLVIETDTRVQRILFDANRRASAVEYKTARDENDDGSSNIQERRTATVRGEIILCAGALGSPKLLMLSGIGPAQHLKDKGVPVLSDRPEVGENLQDHPNVPVFCRTPQEVDALYPQLYSFYRTHEGTNLPKDQADTCYVFWPAPSAIRQMIQRVLPAKLLPEGLYGPRSKRIFRALIEFAFRFPPLQRFIQGLFAIIVILGKPKSRGRLRLASKNPETPALIDPAYLEDPEDMETMVRGVRKAREILSAGELAAWQTKELMPGGRTRSDQAIARYVRKNTISTYHYAGTCRLGEDSDSVVDLELRVRGVTGLRVADASVIPSVPVSALNAPSMLIGLRAARFIREAAKKAVS